MKLKVKPKMSVWRYLSLGYLLVILIGSVLLALPFATRSGAAPSFLDALFTSVSATCVTGLVPFDTATNWSLYGQIVILLLIQLGGLGFTTFVSILLIMVKRGLGLYEKRAVIQSFGSKLLGVKTLVKRIVIGTFAIETAGAAILCIRFIPDFGVGYGIFYAVFHAISAFCNAGFDLMGAQWGADTSLSHYAADPLVCLTICLLIIIGGLGFCIWGDMFDCKFNPKKFQFYTKVILIVNTVLLLLSTFLFLLFEWNASCADFGFREKLLCSFFDATTARTAGFFTTNPVTLSESGYLLTVVLMFIGGCSGSTAGGIKVGTFFVIIMGMVAVLRGHRDINIGKRRIDSSLLGQALAIFAAYLFLIVASALVLCAAESGLTFQQALFNATSAIGTVGLAFTSSFGIVSKIVLILLMYAGRVGVLTLALALGKKQTETAIRKPVDTIYIG